MAIDDEELEKNVEMMSLLPDRYYVILRSTGKMNLLCLLMILLIKPTMMMMTLIQQ